MGSLMNWKKNSGDDVNLDIIPKYKNVVDQWDTLWWFA